MKGTHTMDKLKKKILSDVMYQYASITIYSGNGSIICSWERELLKYYADREIVSIWVNPVDRHAFIHIR